MGANVVPAAKVRVGDRLVDLEGTVRTVESVFRVRGHDNVIGFNLSNGRDIVTRSDIEFSLAGCHWLIEVASGHPEPDSIADTVKLVDCNLPVASEDDPLCEYHREAMDLDGREFEAISEAHGGKAWS